jgi:hypothetical protein
MKAANGTSMIGHCLMRLSRAPLFLRTVLALLATFHILQIENTQAASGQERLVGIWLGLQRGTKFPLACESGEPMRYSADGTFAGPGARGTWQLRDGRLTETATEVDEELGGDPVAIGKPYISDITWKSADAFVKTFSNGSRMTFRRCPGDATAAAAPSSTARRSKAADYLVREQVAEACDGKGGTIDPAAVIEGDLTRDGKADLIISHEGIRCAGGGRSALCGAQLCSVMIYVRRGTLLKLEREMLGANVSVKSGAIRLHAHGGKPAIVRWNGRSFR